MQYITKRNNTSGTLAGNFLNEIEPLKKRCLDRKWGSTDRFLFLVHTLSRRQVLKGP